MIDYLNEQFDFIRFFVKITPMILIVLAFLTFIIIAIFIALNLAYKYLITVIQ